MRALQEAKARKLKTIAFLGRDGGSTIGIADIDLLVKDDSTARIQEAHQLVIHVLCEIIEAQLDKT
jgi:D-sedoheptulose 7-phosphate isomerase